VERNVITLETAIKLKAAGFPQDTQSFWRERNEIRDDWDWSLEPYNYDTDVLLGDEIAAPSAQEIADQLPTFWGKTPLIVQKSEVVGNYVAAYGRDFEAADTMAEALAALWLKLKV
jgi:hypothetical protein